MIVSVTRLQKHVKKSPAKRRKLNSRKEEIKDTEEDNHKIFQNKKKKKNDKKADKKKHEIGIEEFK